MSAPFWSFGPASRGLLTALFVLVMACNGRRADCESICTQLMEGPCEIGAWTSKAQCVQGCLDDLYRRDDADEILTCYQGAIDGPTTAEAEALIDRAIEARLFEAQVLSGTFDRAFEVEALDRRTCDVFSLIECKTRADAAR